MIDAFMSRQYTMVINVKDNAEKFNCQLKISDLKKMNDSQYKIIFRGSDEVGESTLEGLLVFKDIGMGIKLSKVYDNRSNAEQTGLFETLLYEGGGNPDQLNGCWAFHGFEDSAEYSGVWYMTQL